MKVVKLVKIKTLNFDSLKAVVVDGREVGFITKYKNTRTEQHPWKAYSGKGETAKFLGTTFVSEGRACNMVLEEVFHVQWNFLTKKEFHG